MNWQDCKNGMTALFLRGLQNTKDDCYWEPLWHDASTSGQKVGEHLKECQIRRAWIDRAKPHLRWNEEHNAIVARYMRGTQWCGVLVECLSDKHDWGICGNMEGGAIRLCTPSVRNVGQLLVGEDIVSTLSLAQRLDWQGRVWATGKDTAMVNMQIPSDVTRLAIAAVFDGSGLVAAEKIARRAKNMGIKDVHVHLPWEYGMDWNDVLRGEIEA